MEFIKLCIKEKGLDFKDVVNTLLDPRIVTTRIEDVLEAILLCFGSRRLRPRERNELGRSSSLRVFSLNSITTETLSTALAAGLLKPYDKTHF